jgi:hypothetical protein
VKAIIITGTDPVFTVDVDFKEHGAAVDPREGQFTVNPGRALRAIRTPAVCAVNGLCVSGGFEISLKARFVVASERARFADSHARLNVSRRGASPRCFPEPSVNHVPTTPWCDSRESSSSSSATRPGARRSSACATTGRPGFNAAAALETAHAAQVTWDAGSFAAAGTARGGSAAHPLTGQHTGASDCGTGALRRG